jgi:hypothetical protein
MQFSSECRAAEVAKRWIGVGSIRMRCRLHFRLVLAPCPGFSSMFVGQQPGRRAQPVPRPRERLLR